MPMLGKRRATEPSSSTQPHPNSPNPNSRKKPRKSRASTSKIRALLNAQLPPELIGEDIFDSFRTFLNAEGLEADSYFCAITREPMFAPVKVTEHYPNRSSTSTHYFEYSAIIDNLIDSGLNPISKLPMKLSQLDIDIEKGKMIRAALSKFLAQQPEYRAEYSKWLEQWIQTDQKARQRIEQQRKQVQQIIDDFNANVKILQASIATLLEDSTAQFARVADSLSLTEGQIMGHTYLTAHYYELQDKLVQLEKGYIAALTKLAWQHAKKSLEPLTKQLEDSKHLLENIGYLLQQNTESSRAELELPGQHL